MLFAFKDDYKYLTKLFPGASNETIMFYFELDDLMTPIATAFANNQYIFSILAIVFNFFHLIVLLHKSLRSISTNVIMAGIALSDIFFPISTVDTKIRYFLSSYCDPLETYFLVWTNLKISMVADFFRRTSSWLGICLAAVRVIVVTYPLNARSIELTTTKSGFRIICLTLMTSFPLTLGRNFQFELVSKVSTRDPEFCPQLEPDNYTLTTYIPEEIMFFHENDAIVRRVYFMMDSVLSKVPVIDAPTSLYIFQVIPCICYPILSVILLKIVFKSSKTKKTMNRSATSHERPTAVITLVTILYFFAEFPIGIYYLTQSFITSQGIRQVLLSFYYIASCLYTILSSTHLFINFFLSSQYRAAFRTVFLCGRLSTLFESKQKPPSLNSTNSNHSGLATVA